MVVCYKNRPSLFLYKANVTQNELSVCMKVFRSFHRGAFIINIILLLTLFLLKSFLLARQDAREETLDTVERLLFWQVRSPNYNPCVNPIDLCSYMMLYEETISNILHFCIV